jgi:hypothetical protein
MQCAVTFVALWTRVLTTTRTTTATESADEPPKRPPSKQRIKREPVDDSTIPSASTKWPSGSALKMMRLDEVDDEN